MSGSHLRLTALCAAVFVVGFQACATAAVPPDDEPEETDSAVPPPSDATTDRNKPVDSSAPDTAVPPKDAQPDTRDSATVDAADAGFTPYAGDPFDPRAPKTGDPCPVGTPVNTLIDRRCGKCGVQKAFCEAGDGGNLVGAYGPCIGEKTGALNCLPAARELLQCGLCGTQVRQCDATCLWVENACLNEVPGGCLSGEVKHLEGLCADPNEVRRQACGAACAPGAPAPCGPQQADDLAASPVAGDIVTGLFNTTGTTRLLPRLVAGACPVTLSTNTSYHYTRVVNPGAAPVNVTLTNVVPPGQAKLDVLMGLYLGATAIPAPADRSACTAQVLDSPEALTFNVDAGGSAIVYTGAVAAAKTGRLKFELKTNFVGPEVPPAVDYDVVLSEVPGETVTQAVTFEVAQATLRLSVGTCPRTLLTTTTPYKYIRVTNPGVDTLTVDLSLANGYAGTIVAYRGLGAPPISTQRNACSGLVNDTCGAAVAGAESCLANFSIAGGESVYLLGQGTSNVAGATTFSATTK